MASSTSDQLAPHPKRTTFLPSREVLERSHWSLERTRRALKRAPREDERAGLALDRLDAIQRELSVALHLFFDATPDEALEERTQYTVEVPRELEDPEPPATLEDAVAWSLALTRSLRERFEKLSQSAISAPLRESYASLVALVSGYEKRIARLAEGARDL